MKSELSGIFATPCFAVLRSSRGFHLAFAVSYRIFCPASSVLCRAPALHLVTPFEKGVNPKNFLTGRHHVFNRKAEESRLSGIF